MWAYEDNRGRRSRDIPRSRPAYYYDDGYERPEQPSSRSPYQDPPPKSSSSYDRHRRKSALAHSDESRSDRRASHSGVNVVASDDGAGAGAEYPPGKSSSHDVYGSSYPGRTSRHDVEQKTSDTNKHFREKRGTYEEDEAKNLRRAKSHSPRTTAPEAEKSPRPEDDDASGPGRHRSSKKSKKKKKSHQYYDEDPRAGSTASPPTHDKPVDHDNPGYDYDTSASGMPRPPMGDHVPYRSSPLSASAVPEKPSKHSRSRDKPYHSNGYDDYPAAAPGYEPPGYVAEEPPRRSRHGRVLEGRPGWEDDGYSGQTPPQTRGRHRPPPPPPQPDEYADPYERAPPPPRHRDRRSLPPKARSRYDDAYVDPYGGPPPRRAASVHHGPYGAPDRYADPREGSRNRFQDDELGRSSSGGSGSSGKKKGKKWQKQAGQLFMTHAVPVIKKEAVPLLTKAAHAYFEQQRAK